MTCSAVKAAHACIRREVRGVYALDDQQPMSTTIRRGRGSCSQRLAIVEGLARRHSIHTRVRGLVLHGEFWYPRFRYLHGLVPDRVLLGWPEFLVDGRWLDASEVFDGGTARSMRRPSPTAERRHCSTCWHVPRSTGPGYRHGRAWTCPVS